MRSNDSFLKKEIFSYNFNMLFFSAQGQAGGSQNNATTSAAPRGRTQSRGTSNRSVPFRRAHSEGYDRERCEDVPGRRGKRGRGSGRSRGRGGKKLNCHNLGIGMYFAREKLTLEKRVNDLLFFVYMNFP